MNAAQIHLALNHAPLFLSAVGGGILILGMIRKNGSFKTLALWLLAAGALFTLPVYLTGEGTEELVEHLPGVNENAIEKHEAMANISLAVIAVTGVAALAGLFFRKNAAAARIIVSVCFLLSLGSFGTMAQTAHLGGLIRHSEIQNGATAASEDNEAEEGEEGNKPGSNKVDSSAKDSLKQAEKAERKKEEKDDDD